MTDSMIDRVANALRVAEGCSDAPVADCDLCKTGRRDSCVGMARSAIAAMREPTLAMRKVCRFKTAEIEYPSMIDAALAEGSASNADT